MGEKKSKTSTQTDLMPQKFVSHRIPIHSFNNYENFIVFQELFQKIGGTAVEAMPIGSRSPKMNKQKQRLLPYLNQVDVL